MTAVVCWFDYSPESPFAPWPWVVADSRFSHSSSNREVLIDQGTKIFSFPLIVGENWGEGNVSYYKNIGLAFAGNTLVAQNSMLCLASICSNLVYRANPDIRLSLEHIACLAADLATQYKDLVRIW